MSGFTINRTIQSGNLTRDPELRSLPSGTSLCKLGLAVNERYKDSVTGEWADRANYFDWTVWGGIGEWVANNMRQGDGVTLEGRARWHSWETDDGAKRNKVEFTADSIAPHRSGGGGNGSQRQRRESEQAEYQPEPGFSNRTDVPADSEQDFAPATGGAADDDDIPF